MNELMNNWISNFGSSTVIVFRFTLRPVDEQPYALPPAHLDRRQGVVLTSSGAGAK